MRLALVLLALAAVSCEMDATSRPEREDAKAVSSPNVAGSSLPGEGRSLFDLIVRDGVPFPFSRLVEAVAHYSPQPKVVLIPLGRSLQRTAAAPDFFSFPRFVLAADGEAAASPLTVKDRLFLGYQEKAGVIEVISYNETAGRFEFQVVKDYREGAKPQVFYANRAVCISCHQNGGPIFSRALWDETNANVRLAERLSASRSDFYGISPVSGVDTPNAIDDATDRANLFSLYQMLWREGCEDDACRGELALDLLRYRLGGKLAAGNWAQKWKTRWPDGIALPNPDLTNRDPLLRAADDIDAEDEALHPRPPQLWDPASGADRVLAGFAELVSHSEIARLDDWLLHREAQTAHYRSGCKFSRTNNVLDIDCEGDFSISGRLRVENREVRKGSLDALVMQNVKMRDLEVTGNFDLLRVRRENLTARLPDGSALEALRLTSTQGKQLCAPRCEGEEGAAEITVRDDLVFLRNEIGELVAEKNEVLSAKSFRPSALARALLGEASVATEKKLPPAKLDSAAHSIPSTTLAQSFQRRCANCHHGNDRVPPNFLTGDAATVEQKIGHCAERIYVRLAMHGVPEGERAKTPMPPANAQEGLTSDEIDALRDRAGAMIRRERGALPSLDELLERGYEKLRECLPS